MDWVDTLRSDRSDQDTDSSVFSSITCSPDSVGHSFPIGCPYFVEKNDFAFDFISQLVQLVLIFNNDNFSSNISSNWSSKTNERQLLWYRSWIIQSQLFLTSNPFGKVRNSFQVDIIEPLFMSHTTDFTDNLLQSCWSPQSGSIGICNVG